MVVDGVGSWWVVAQFIITLFDSTIASYHSNIT